MRAIRMGVAGLVAALAACEQAPETPVAACEASSPGDGRAWIDTMPGPNDNPTLHVTFAVDAPKAGDQYTLVFNSVQKKMPPNYVYDLVRTSGTGADVITRTPVEFASAKFAATEVDKVIILCGGKDFYEITPVEVVH